MMSSRSRAWLLVFVGSLLAALLARHFLLGGDERATVELRGAPTPVAYGDHMAAEASAIAPKPSRNPSRITYSGGPFLQYLHGIQVAERASDDQTNEANNGEPMAFTSLTPATGEMLVDFDPEMMEEIQLGLGANEVREKLTLCQGALFDRLRASGAEVPEAIDVELALTVRSEDGVATVEYEDADDVPAAAISPADMECFRAAMGAASFPTEFSYEQVIRYPLRFGAPPH